MQTTTSTPTSSHPAGGLLSLAAAWPLALALVVLALPAHASLQVEQAMTLIRGTCMLPNAALDIKPTPEGRLELRITLADGQRRATTLVRSDLDAFHGAAAALVSSQPVDLLGCMDPYINSVTTGLVGLPQRPGGAAPALASPGSGSGGGGGLGMTGGAAPGAYVPPSLPSPVLPAQASQPARPSYPATGDLPVEAINNPAVYSAGMAAAGGLSTAQSAGQASAGGLLLQVTGCRAAGRHVVCDVKVSNDSGKDVSLVVQGSYSRLYGEDGSQVQAASVALGNQQGDLRYGNQQVRLKLIAGTAPVVNLVFHNVPEALAAIKRLEVSMGPQLTSGVQLQKITLADVAIQGR